MSEQRADGDVPDGEESPPVRSAVSSGPIAELREQGDVEGLLELAHAYRKGTGEVPRDLGLCLECYLAAGELGSAEGEYAAALFLISGLAGEQDFAGGVARLRGAAAKGHVSARVYLGNIYELGLHYEADADKADLWYRSAARAAGVEHEPGTRDYSLALAALGSVREHELLREDESIDPDERRAFQRKARGLGLGELERQQQRALELTVAESKAAPVSEADAAEASTPADPPIGDAASSTARRPVAPEPGAAVPGEDPGRSEPPVSWTPGAGLGAWLAATLFLAAAGAAGSFAAHGVRATLGAEAGLAGLPSYEALALPATLALLGLGPCLLLYRPRAVLVGVVLAVLAGAAGWLLWDGVAALLADRAQQTAAAAATGFLVATGALGLRGGTRRAAAAAANARVRPTSDRGD